MKLSQESRYALNAVAFLARQPKGTIVESADIAEALDVSPAFLSKILQRLTRGRILAGHRGANRGYSLARASDRISARDVVLEIEGKDLFERCIFWSSPCSDARPCMLHHEWAVVRPQVERRLAHLSAADLAVQPATKKRRR